MGIRGFEEILSHPAQRFLDSVSGFSIRCEEVLDGVWEIILGKFWESCQEKINKESTNKKDRGSWNTLLLGGEIKLNQSWTCYEQLPWHEATIHTFGTNPSTCNSGSLSIFWKELDWKDEI